MLTPWYLRRFFGLAPLGWLLAALAALFVWIAVARWLDDLTAWLPWSDESKLERAETRASTAESGLSARTLEVEGERDQAQRVEAAAVRASRAAISAAEAIAEARNAPDATDHLPTDRADRLNRVDDGLCVVSPALVGCAPAPVPPDGGDDAL